MLSSPAIDFSIRTDGYALPPPAALPPRSRERFTPHLVPVRSGELVSMQDGRRLHLRGIAPSDILALRRCFLRLSPEDVRRRFLHAMSDLPKPLAHRLCQIDRTRETALVLVDELLDSAEIRGVGRIYANASDDSAEFSLLVEKDWTRRGLGSLLMNRLLDDCRRRGLTRIWGYVLLENRPMLELCREFGFIRHRLLDEPGTAQVSLIL